ncbi:glycoside hydrolase family 18 protein [Rutstroemia sp. NJR-2017a BBW]|nr:glycoside hydrolase family 18 protein [Rutstroemia sp. NJR-2017a BBW]
MPITRPLAVAAWLLLGARVVNAALNLDGTQAVQPLEDDDPSPIGDLTTYYPDQHDCPLPCADYANMHSWIPYFSVKRLQRCKQPMLLQLSVTQLLDDPASNILIRTCTLMEPSITSLPTSLNGSPNLELLENPKKGSDLFQASSEIAPACHSIGTRTSGEMELFTSSSGPNGDRGDVDSVLKGLQKFFETTDNCDEAFAFAYHDQTVASVYIGPGLGKPTVTSAL